MRIFIRGRKPGADAQAELTRALQLLSVAGIAIVASTTTYQRHALVGVISLRQPSVAMNALEILQREGISASAL